MKETKPILFCLLVIFSFLFDFIVLTFFRTGVIPVVIVVIPFRTVVIPAVIGRRRFGHRLVR